MSVFEITIQPKQRGAWPVVAEYEPEPNALEQRSRGRFELDPGALVSLLPSDKAYGQLLGKALFRDDIRDAFVRAVGLAAKGNAPLRVVLIVDAGDLRSLHRERLHAPLDRDWDYLLLNQGTPFSLYPSSQISRPFPAIGRRELRALVLVAGPEELEMDYGLASFDVAATAESIQKALGDIECDLLASLEGACGRPTLSDLCERLTAGSASGSYTLLQLVCHGKHLAELGDTVLYFPGDGGQRPAPATAFIERLGRLDRLPHLAFLATCELADPLAEAGLGGLGQRLARELGIPAVLAMTGQVSITTAQALATAFYARLGEHGEVDLALCEALLGLQGQHDVTVPALFSRLRGRALWSDATDRPAPEDQGEALRIYRQVLVNNSRHLPLRGVDVGASDPTGKQQRLELSQVYVDLATRTQVPLSDEEKALRQEPAPLEREGRETRPLRALEAAVAERRLVLLAVGRLVYLGGDTDKPLALVGELCPERSVDDTAAWQKAWLAGEVLLEVGLNRVQDGALGRDLARRVRQRLVELLEQSRLTPVERAAAGRALAGLGDPRPGVGVDPGTDLPDVVWCEVPAGPFLMGSKDDSMAYRDEKPQHPQEIAYGYWIARYPVTNAQFDAFVAAGGYGERRYWPEAEAAGYWQDGQVTMRSDEKPRDRPVDPGGAYNLPNHPVVNVSWYEALAFSRWLEEVLPLASSQQQAWRDGRLETVNLDFETCSVRLPTEAEWEKAARGTDGRAFPWGAQVDPNRANYADTQIGTTSTVGCFPAGGSPYGVLDLSGNVYEWCQTVWRGDYQGYKEKAIQSATAEGSRVLRGGAFGLSVRGVRCASRFRGDPFGWYDFIGFRVVVAPGSPLPSGDSDL